MGSIFGHSSSYRPEHAHLHVILDVLQYGSQDYYSPASHGPVKTTDYEPG